MYKHITYIVPGFNFRGNIYNLLQGFREQKNSNFSVEIIDDASTDDSLKEYLHQVDLVKLGFPCAFTRNVEKKFALRNIVEMAVSKRIDDIIAIVDADDCLCNPNATDLVLAAYNDGADIVWTAHKWDVDERMNVSKALPVNVDPYQYPWCASHLRTFRVSELNKINVANFKDVNGNYFERGYDQSLMLPLLKVAKDRRYINEVCYLYKIDSVSIPKELRNYNEVKQLTTVSFVRARGFVI